MHVGLVYRGRYHLREALDLETCAAVLRQAGHGVSLFWDENAFGVTDNVLQVPWLAERLSRPERLLSHIASARPDVLLFSVLPATYGWSRQVAQAVKWQTSAVVVFMGFHSSMVPERCLADSFVDYAIQGEVEGVLAALLEAIGGQRDPADVGNLWYRRDGEVRRTQQAPLVDLDALPLPDKELFRPGVSHGYSYCAMVSRGCPFSCAFCEETCSKGLYGPRYFRRKRVETVMRELVAGKQRYGFREVIFKDSYLSGDKSWLRDLMRRYRAEIRAPFKCFCTISGFDEETARLVKWGGCYGIEFGLQTWNETLRRDTLHRRETNEKALQAFDICDRLRLWYDVDHMFNLPGEAEQDHVLGARQYAKLRHLNRIKNHFLVYLPNAAIVAEGRQRGVVPDNVDDLLAEGWEGDFYDQKVGNAEERAVVAAYAALYKVLPVLPRGWLDCLLRDRRVMWLRHVPSVALAAVQGLMALRSGDLRFAEYLRSYPCKVWRAVRAAMAGDAASPRREAAA